MLLVKTELKPSPLHGLGIFAAEFIPRGNCVWVYVAVFDRRLSREFVASLPNIARRAVEHYCCFWGNGYVVSADNSRFLNHSDSPNLVSTIKPDASYATRDIQVGEELLEDYREFDQTFSDRFPVSVYGWALPGEEQHA